MKIQSSISAINYSKNSSSVSEFKEFDFNSSQSSLFIKKNPFNLSELHQVVSAELIDVVYAMKNSQLAFQEWKVSSINDRINLLNKIKNYISDHSSEIALHEALDQGLPYQFVYDFSIISTLNTVNRVIGELELALQKSTHSSKKYEPVGVVSIIASWNLSFRVVAERLFTALAAGNTAIVKVSSMSPITASILNKMISVVGLHGLVQVIVSNKKEVTELLVSHPIVKAVSFCGEPKNAVAVIQNLAQQSHLYFKKIQISSGSKNSAVVLQDVNDEIFQKVIESFLIGQGQLVWNSARLFILEKNENEWQQRLQNYLAELKPSESIEDKSLWTPCLKKSSFEFFEDLSRQAKEDQARLIKTQHHLSHSEASCYLPITFTQDMSKCSTLQQDQVLAPLFILSAVKYAFDIPKNSNVSYFGHSAHLWGDVDKLSKISEQLDVGQVCHNKWSVQISENFQSVKQSGFGLQDYSVFGAFYSNVKILS